MAGLLERRSLAPAWAHIKNASRKKGGKEGRKRVRMRKKKKRWKGRKRDK